jgi:acyl carrier protein
MRQLRHLRQASGSRSLIDSTSTRALATGRVVVSTHLGENYELGGDMNSDALNAVINAVSIVMELPADILDSSTAFRAINADSVALIVIADVIEDRFPQYVVSDDVLKSSATIGDLAAGLKVSA